ncbi:hypothetical protein U1Q18_040558 [Sarracenia purpurea var. burkii]
MSPASFKAVSGGASEVPESVSEEVDLEVENKQGADDDSGMGDCGATQGGCENRCKKSGIDVDEGNGIETPTSGIDEVDEAKNEEENRVEGLGTNACPEVAASAGFEPLNQTSKLDYASELNDFAVDVYGVEKGRLVAADRSHGDGGWHLRHYTGWISGFQIMDCLGFLLEPPQGSHGGLNGVTPDEIRDLNHISRRRAG